MYVDLIESLVMAKKEMGTVKSPTGFPYKYYWDASNGAVHVAREFAGKAASADEAWRKANYYATIGQIMR